MVFTQQYNQCQYEYNPCEHDLTWYAVAYRIVPIIIIINTQLSLTETMTNHIPAHF